MTAESISLDTSYEVCSKLHTGDEVEYAHAAHDYAGPVTVVEVSATEWLNPEANWRSATLVIDTGSTEREIVAVEGVRGPRDYGSGGPFLLRQLEPVGEPEPEDPIEVVEAEPSDELEYFTDHDADPGDRSTCQNCGSHVSPRFAKVMDPEGENGPRCCPNCSDLTRDSVTHEVREKRSGGCGSTVVDSS